MICKVILVNEIFFKNVIWVLDDSLTKKTARYLKNEFDEVIPGKTENEARFGFKIFYNNR